MGLRVLASRSRQQAWRRAATTARKTTVCFRPMSTRDLAPLARSNAVVQSDFAFGSWEPRAARFSWGFLRVAEDPGSPANIPAKHLIFVRYYSVIRPAGFRDARQPKPNSVAERKSPSIPTSPAR